MKYEYLLVENEEYFVIDKGIDFPPSFYFKKFHESAIIELHFETFFDLDSKLVLKSKEEVRSQGFNPDFVSTRFNFFIDPEYHNIIGLGFLTLGLTPVFRESDGLIDSKDELLSPVLSIKADDFMDDNKKYLPVRGFTYNNGLIKIGFGKDYVKLYFSVMKSNRIISNGSCLFGVNEPDKEIVYIRLNNLSPELIYHFAYNMRPEEWESKYPQIYNNPKPHEFIQYGYIDAMW